MKWGLQRLHSLKLLVIVGDYRDVESFAEEDLLPTSISYLGIGGFPNLRSLDKKSLQHLTSLQQLAIMKCPELKHMPEEGLPVSISYLRIEECPRLLTSQPYILTAKSLYEPDPTPFDNQVFLLFDSLLILLAFFLILFLDKYLFLK